MAVIRRLHLRLFLEGQESPVSAANITISKNAPARASISLPYTPEINLLKPRTLVHLFFYNERSSASGIAVDESTIATSDAAYSLLFMGELLGLNVAKSDASQTAELICEDFTSYHKTAYAYFMASADFESTDIGEFVREKAAFTAATTSYGLTGSSDFLGMLSNIFKAGSRPMSPGFQDAVGLLGGLLKTIETFTGLSSNDVGGANQFFNMAELRLKLLSQIGVYANDRTSEKLLSASFIINFVKQKVDSLGQLITLDQILRYLLEYMYYAIGPNPAARYVPASQTTISAEAPETVKQLVTELTTLTDGETLYETEPGADDSSAKVKGVLTAIDNLAVSDDFLSKKLRKRFISILRRSNVLNEDIKSALTVFANGEYASQITTVPKVPTTVILPDLFFAVAPTCNVLFPDMYNSVSYQQMSALEATRHHLSTDFDARLTGQTAGRKVYYAPSVEEIAQTQSELYSNPETVSSNIIFDHERFTGIIPSFSRSDRIVYELALNEAELGNNLSDHAERTKDFFVRVANYRFLKQKLARRTLSVNGIFNPFAVVGTPMIIIDRPDLPGPENYIGLLESITHTISQEGGASTSYSLSHVRPQENQQDAFLDRLLLPANTLELTRENFRSEIIDLSSAKYDLEKLRILLQVAQPLSALKTIDFVGAPVVVPVQPGPFQKGKYYNGDLVFCVSVLETVGQVEETRNISTFIINRLQRGELTDEELRAFGRSLPEQLPTHYPTKVEVFFRIETNETLQVPQEEALRPRFIDDVYSSAKIHEVYSQLYACTSVTQYMSKQVSEDEKTTIALSGQKEEVVPQKVAVDKIIAAYRRAPLRADFAFDFVQRDIATLPDILGTPANPEKGFHHGAFGPQTFVLANPLVNETRLSTQPSPESCGPGTVTLTQSEYARLYPAIDPKLDVRVEKYEAVSKYIQSLTNRIQPG